MIPIPESIFKDTFCLSKKKCTNGHDALAMDIKIFTRIDACSNFHANVMDFNQNTVVHRVVTSAKVLIFVLALELMLAIASAMKN